MRPNPFQIAFKLTRAGKLIICLPFLIHTIMIYPYLDRYFLQKLLEEQHAFFEAMTEAQQKELLKAIENPDPESTVWIDADEFYKYAGVYDKIKQTEECLRALKN